MFNMSKITLVTPGTRNCPQKFLFVNKNRGASINNARPFSLAYRFYS